MANNNFPIYADDRGFISVFEIFSGCVQINTSYNKNKYTFRGIHTQINGAEQTKVIRVLSGKALVITINLNRSSQNFGEISETLLEVGQEITVPKGFGNSFLTLEDNTLIQYGVDYPYSPENEKRINWKSIPDIKKTVISYSQGNPITISEQDNTAPLFQFSDF
jgi:dTDP-4-dehydrorhamnose 3,5-epimerase